MARATRSDSRLSGLQQVLSLVLVGIGCLAIGLYITTHWIKDQILTTDNWVALVAPLPKEPVVSDALGAYIGKHIFSAVDVEAAISDVLPPRAVILAPPIAAQLETITVNTSKKIVASDTFQTLWSGANRLAMNRLVSQAEGGPTPLEQRINERFDLNLAGVREQLRERLGLAAEAIPSLQPATNTRLALSVDLQSKRERLYQFIRSVNYSAAVLPMVVTAAFLGALALSRKRRKTTMTIAIGCMVVLLLELIAIKVLRQRIIDQVQDPANIPAVTFIFDTIIASLRQTMYWVLGAALFVFAVCTVLGPAGWARSLRSTLRMQQLSTTRLVLHWRQVRRTMQRHQTVLYLAIAGLVLAYMALFMEVGSESTANTILATISLMAVVRIMATPPTVKPALQTAARD